MRCYVMEPVSNILLPVIPKRSEVVLSSDLGRFREIDYDARSGLISERLKLLMELYMPKHDFEPVVYLDQAKDAQAVYWKLMPSLHSGYDACYRNDGIVSHISFLGGHPPIVFLARSPKGVRSVVVRMAVAESALRRGILGLKFTKLLDMKEVSDGR